MAAPLTSSRENGAQAGRFGAGGALGGLGARRTVIGLRPGFPHLSKGLTERIARMNIRHGGFAVLLVAVAGCSGPDRGAPAQQPGAEPQQTVAAAEDVPPSGPIDESLAASGEKLFQNKGCIGCHTIGGGRLTGPDLMGVTERREYAWIMAIVVNPDSMLKNDATARKMLQEYMTPMMNMGVSRTEARAIYEHLRRHSGT